jgi:hypothetical protein
MHNVNNLHKAGDNIFVTSACKYETYSNNSLAEKTPPMHASFQVGFTPGQSRIRPSSRLRFSPLLPAGRQRFNVLGAWNAVTRELTYVANTTVVNTETMCELLRKIAAQQLAGPITLVLDNARYQRNAVVQACSATIRFPL